MLTFAKVPAEKGCECQHRTTRGYEGAGRLNRHRRVPEGCPERRLPDSLAACHDSVWKAPTELREGTAVMKFALHFGNNTFSDPEGARRLARLAEAAGFDSVFAVEHVVFPDNYTSVYPYAPGGRLPASPSG